MYGLKSAGDQETYFKTCPWWHSKTLDETSFNFVAPDVGAMTLKNLEDFVISNEGQTETAFITPPGSRIPLPFGSFQLGAGRDPLFFHFGRFEIQKDMTRAGVS